MRPVFLLAFFMIGLTLHPLTFAWAQETAPLVEPLIPAIETVAEPNTWQSLATLVRESFTAALLAGVTMLLAWLSTKFQRWFGVNIDLKETLDSVEWEKYVDDVARKAFSYAQTKIGIGASDLKTAEQKEGFLRWAAYFVEHYNDDIMKFLDKNGNNVLDVLETRLVGLAPSHVFVQPLSADGAQGFRSPPKQKKPAAQMELPEDVAAAMMASKLKPRRV